MEEWETVADFQAHLTAPHVAAFHQGPVGTPSEVNDQPERIYCYHGPEF